MKTFNLLLTLVLLIPMISSCKKDDIAANSQVIIPIPNGDFEFWDDMPNLVTWETNSCPACVPGFETYIVRKVTDAASGEFAAKFICNNVYKSYATNKFQISTHPSVLTAYIKSNIAIGDTATVRIDLFSDGNIVDGGNLFETTSSTDYRKVTIPISQNSQTIDFALIKINGGSKTNTEICIDDLVFIKN